MKKTKVLILTGLTAAAVCLAPLRARAEEIVDVTCHVTVNNLDDVQIIKTGDSGQYDVSVDPVDGVAIHDSVEFVSGNESVLEISKDGKWKALASGTATVWMVVEYSQETWSKLIDAHPEATKLVTAPQGQQFAVWVDVDPNTLFRLYNPNSGEHFYTQDVIEQRGLINAGWNDEGSAWVCPETSDVPIYRLYNPNAGDHHYTSDAAERDTLVSVGWNDEGISFYAEKPEAEGSVPVYRLYNPNAVSGAHHYTPDAAERDTLIAAGWKDEGTAWYSLPAEK